MPGGTVSTSGGGEADHEAGAVRWVLVDAHGAAVTLDGALRDGEAEAHAAGVARASFVEAREPLEHSLAVLGCDAGTVIGDDQLDGPVGLGQRHRHAGFGVPSSIVDEVADDAG